MKSPIRRLLVVLIIAFILLFIWMLKWWMPWMSFEVPWWKLTEVYTTIWSYNIWKEKFRTNICNKEDWCLNGEILWFKENKYDIYIYIKPNFSTITWTINEDLFWYDYQIYKNEKSKIFKNIDSIPIFWYLSNNKLEFYSEKDLEKLPKEQQKIFKDLEENPTVIIDWVDYTKK